MTSIRQVRIRSLAVLSLACSLGAGVGMLSKNVHAAGDDAPGQDAPQTEPGSRVHLDRSGRKQVGKASFYASHYAGKKMADGTPMRLYSNNAASLTLPLGTTAKVTNLETGKSAVVVIQDRGPYVKGRIVDLSPLTARKIGIQPKQGLAKVEVVPLSIPMPNGTVKVLSTSREDRDS